MKPAWITACVLLLAPWARAERIYTAPTDVVAAHAELVVRARVDLDARRAKILTVYRGDVEGTIEVRNLRDFTDSGALVGAREPTEEAVLFLDELDGRYYLVHTSSPAWIRPHAAILYLTTTGRVLEYGQLLSGVLQLREREGATRESLEEDLDVRLERPRAPRHERPSLPPSDADRLYRWIDPFVDLHRREVVTEPHGQQLARALNGLAELAIESKGELRRRTIEALLVLGRQWGPDQNRRGRTEERLTTLLDRLGPEPFVDPCLDEIRSLAVSANRETAAKLLRRIGGRPREQAREALLQLLAGDRGTLRTQAYFALEDLGFAADAERALRSSPREER